MRSVAALYLASDSACLRVATSVVAPTISSILLSFFAIAPSYRHFFYKVSLTFFLLELPFGKAKLLLGLLEALLQGIHLRSQCGGGQQRSLHTYIDSFLDRKSVV